MLTKKNIIFISCEEHHSTPSGGGNDILSDIYLLDLLKYKISHLVIDKRGRIKDKDKNEFIDPTKLKIFDSILFFSGFLSAERFTLILNLDDIINKKIMNIKDIHFVRELRKEMLLKLKGNHQNIQKREMNMFSKMDLLFSYNELELNFLKKLNPNLNISRHYYCNPNFNSVNCFNFSNRLLFSGNFEHHPNLDGINYLLSEFQDLLFKLDWNYEIYGPHSNKIIDIPYKIRNHIKIMGFVGQATDIYKQGGVFLSPIRYGSGIKIKIIEAALSHLPIIATEESIEGLGLINNESVLVYKNSEDLANILEYVRDCTVNKKKELLELANAGFNAIYQITNVNLAKNRLNRGIQNLA